MCAAPFDIDPGRGRGQVFHRFDGFSYHQNRRVTHLEGQAVTIYLRCVNFATRVCPGKAIVRVNGEGLEWEDTHDHTCQPDPHASQCRQFRHAVLQACRNELYVRPRQLFFNISERFHPAIVERFGGDCLRSSMRLARLGQYPNAPATLLELGQLLQQPQYQHLSAAVGGNDNVVAGVIGNPGHECLLFLSNRMGRFLSKYREVFADATFVPAPVRPHCSQVYQIVVLEGHNVIPVAQILMPDKEYVTYKGMLNGLRQHLPNFRPRLLHVDYELAQIRAWEEEFPDIVTRGCFFHYIKAVLKKVRQLGLTRLIKDNREVRILIRSFLSIPLLPHEDMHRGMFVLIRRALRLDDFNALVPFFDYYVNTWMVGARYEALSVYRQQNRTNNAAEAAQRNLRTETGPHHPNIWHFICAIRRYEWTSYISSRRARRGLPIGRRQQISTLRNDVVIRLCTARLDEGNMSIKRFLHVTATRVIGVFYDILRLRRLVR